MALKDLFDIGLPQNFDLLTTWFLQSTMNWTAVKLSMPVLYCHYFDQACPGSVALMAALSIQKIGDFSS